MEHDLLYILFSSILENFIKSILINSKQIFSFYLVRCNYPLNYINHD